MSQLNESTWTYGETIRELPGRIPTRLRDIGDGRYIIEFNVDGHIIGFNGDWIPEEHLEWFSDVLSDCFMELSKLVKRILNTLIDINAINRIGHSFYAIENDLQ